MTDPYELLGLKRGASAEEVRHAYHTLAKQSHPDRMLSPEARQDAEEKMKALNEAYHLVLADLDAEEESAGRPAPEEKEEEQPAAALNPVRILINAGKTGEAETMLDAIPQEERAGEWNFLRGCVLIQRGWYTEAQRYLETACYLAPSNNEYRTFLDNLRSGVRKAQSGEEKRSRLSDFSCQNALCDCLGGDISCC